MPNPALPAETATHSPPGPAGQGTQEHSFLPSRAGVPGEVLQKAKTMRTFPCLCSLFHDLLA